MNYRTKKEILTSSRLVPAGVVITPHVFGYYKLMIDGMHVMSFDAHIVENTPEYFEPVREWTDDDMIAFGRYVRDLTKFSNTLRTMNDHLVTFKAFKK